jgi:hypothetical protein
VRKLVLASLVWSGAVFAQPSPGAVLFEEGRTLSQKGDYAGACDRFEKSYAAERATGTLLNLGDCHEHLGHLAQSWRYFDEAATKLDAAKDDRAKFARLRRDAITPKTGAVVVKGASPGVRITIAGREEAARTEVTDRVDPGDIEVHVGDSIRHVTVAAGETAVVVANLPAGETPPTTAPSDEGERSPKRKMLSYGLWGVGGAGFITGVALGLVGRSNYQSQLDSGACSKSTGTLVCTPAGGAKMNDAIHLANIGTGVGVAGLVLVAAGTVLYVTAPRDHIAVAPAATPTSAGVVLTRRW